MKAPPYLDPVDRLILRAAAAGDLVFGCGRWSIVGNDWQVPNKPRKRLTTLGLLNCSGAAATITETGRALLMPAPAKDYQ